MSDTLEAGPDPRAPKPDATPLRVGAPRAGPRGWFPSLQSLRGLAALWVVFYHMDLVFANFNAPLLPVPGLRVGWLGVDLFFVLSAYLLGQPFIDGRARPYRTFMADRVLRVAPAYYAAWILTAVFYFFFQRQLWHIAWSGFSLVFLGNNYSKAMFALNPAFWTLAVEMQFYLILPFLARLFAGPRWGWALAGCVILASAFRAVTFRWGGAEGLSTGSYAMPAFLAHFGLGLAACRIRTIPKPHLAILPGLLLVGAPAALWIRPGSLTFGYESFEGQTLIRPFAAAGFALLVLAAASPGPFSRLLTLAPLRWLGDISYSLYLIHIPALLASDLAIHSSRNRALFIVAGLGASIGAGAALHRFVEKPAEEWRHQRKLRQRTGSGGAPPPKAANPPPAIPPGPPPAT